MTKKIKSVVILGAPKCSTSYLGKFFESSDNFDIVRHPTNRLECYENIYNVSNLEYKFAKTPSWIFDGLWFLCSIFTIRRVMMIVRMIL